jgi:hypothetical protein
MTRLSRNCGAGGRHRLIVQIVADLEDERTSIRWPGAARELQPLVPLLRAGTGARVVVLNWARSASLPLAKQLAEAGACLDIATVENVGGWTTWCGNFREPGWSSVRTRPCFTSNRGR